MIKARGRSIVVLAAVLGWLPIVAAAAELSDHEKQLYAAAKQEGELTWYTGHYDQALATKIGNAFTKKYPGVQTNAIKATAQVTFQRLLQDIKAGQIQSDVFSSTDISHFVYLKQNGNLEKYVPDNEDKIVPALRKLDPDGFYTVTWAGLCAIAYNKDKVKAEAAPQNWPDLADPKWTGQVTVGSPNFSGSVGVWMVGMTTLYGWDYFTKLNQVKPLIGRSIDDAVTVLNAGERMVAMADPAAIGRSAAKGNPLGIIYPTDGTIAVIGPSALVKGSKSPNAGKLFLEFLLSPEAVTLIAENFEQSVRPDVPPPPGAKPLAELKFVRPSIEAITKELPGEKEKWKETFGQ